MKMSVKFGFVVASFAIATLNNPCAAQKLSVAPDYTSQFQNDVTKTIAATEIPNATNVTPPDETFENTHTIKFISPKIVNTHSVSKNSIVVYLKDASNSKIEVILKDDNDNTIFNKSVKNVTTFAERLNLKSLPYGNYTFTTFVNLTKTVQPFTFSAEGVVMAPAKRAKTFLPQIVQHGNVFDINLLLNTVGDVNVTVLNAEGEVVFTETSNKVIVLNKRYNVAQLGHGQFLVQVNANGETEELTLNL